MKKYKLKRLVYALIFCTCLGGTTFSNKSSRDCVKANAYLGDGTTDQLFNRLTSIDQGECFIDNTYASYYFKNLRENFGNNAFGSCGYVAIGMLFSFYDAYWNDDIIPSQYDVNVQYIPSTNSNVVPYNTNSPGVKFESRDLFKELTKEEYFTFASENENLSFQFKLFESAKKCLDNSKFNLSNVDFTLTDQEALKLVQYYLYNERNFDSKNDVSLSFSTQNAYGQEILKSRIIDGIKTGNPSLLIVKNEETSNAHAVIAYDYDAKNDDIYVHCGWRDENTNQSITHVSLKRIGYEKISSYIQLSFKEKKIGKKYFSSSSNGQNAEIFLFPQKIELVSGNYLDMEPTFKWKSLASEKWEAGKNPYFKFSILDGNSKLIFQIKEKITETTYKLDLKLWEQVCYSNQTNSYYIYLELASDSYPYWDDYYSKQKFEIPKNYNNIPVIKSNEYGFSDSYPTDLYTRSTYQKHTVRNLTFETRRYRVGHIHNESLVMSPIRKNINEAFIEYRFQRAVNRIDVELAHWREQSKELLSKSNGKSVIQTFLNDSWVDVFDLLSDNTNLTRDRNKKTLFKIEFPQPTYMIRFYSHYDLPNMSDSNKGRICIGNIALYESEYNLPLSGYEIKYEPDVWNNTVTWQFLFFKNYLKDSTNCYSYALNAQVNPFTNSLKSMQPGMTSGYYSLTPYSTDFLDTQKVLSYIRYDASYLGFEFLDNYDGSSPCPSETYRVAFVIDNEKPQYDYHWYRQNKDGSWSHKPGNGNVTNKDSDNKVIMDPRTCNRKSNDDKNLNYVNFVGFYSVKPLNTIYKG